MGVEIDLDYSKMAARHLKAESGALFVDAELVFERAVIEGNMCVVSKAPDLSHTRPVKSRLDHSPT